MLAPIIIKQIVKLAKGTARFDALADSMMEKFENGCPPAGELERIIQQKQQIVTALSQVSTVINTITKIGTTLDGILTGLNIAVNVIKFLPIPLPPFSPALLATGPAVAVDILGDLVKAGKGAVKIIPGALSQIADGINALIEKLNSIDGVLNPCLEAAGLDDAISGEGLSDLLASSGVNSDPNANKATDEELLQQLQPNADPGLFYKGWKLTVQNEPDNTFTFPSRRILGEKDGEKMYNLSDEGYSFSSSVQVLIDEIKFRIDLLPISDGSLLAKLDSNQSGSSGETGTCSIGGFTTRAECEGAGGIFTPDNAGNAGADGGNFGGVNLDLSEPNRLAGSGILTPQFFSVSAKLIIPQPPCTLRMTAATGNLDIELPLNITFQAVTILQFTATPLSPDAIAATGGTPYVVVLGAGPGDTGGGSAIGNTWVNTQDIVIPHRGIYQYSFKVLEDKFPDAKDQQIGTLEVLSS